MHNNTYCWRQESDVELTVEIYFLFLHIEGDHQFLRPPDLYNPLEKKKL